VSLGSASESVEIAVTPQQEVAVELEPEPQAVELVEVGGENAKECTDNDPNELKQMLAGIMAVIQASNEKLQASVKADNESVRKDLSSVSTEIRSVKNDINSVKTDLTSKFSKLQEDLRAEIKSENEKLIKKFELQSQKHKIKDGKKENIREK
jgi:hypothetical protein